jgi:hypothetical protein
VTNREQGLNPGAMAFPAGPPPVSLRLASEGRFDRLIQKIKTNQYVYEHKRNPSHR